MANQVRGLKVNEVAAVAKVPRLTETNAPPHHLVWRVGSWACTQELGTRTGLLPAGWPIILKRKAVLLADQSGSHMRTKIELLPTNNPRGWFAYATLLGVLRSSELALD